MIMFCPQCHTAHALLGNNVHTKVGCVVTFDYDIGILVTIVLINFIQSIFYVSWGDDAHEDCMRNSY